MRYVGRTFRFDYPAEFKTLPEYTAHAGQMVTVIRRLKPTESDFLMYQVRATDGWTGHACPSELVEC